MIKTQIETFIKIANDFKIQLDGYMSVTNNYIFKVPNFTITFPDAYSYIHFQNESKLMILTKNISSSWPTKNNRKINNILWRL
jgi:hypothetical protein